jgi:hypothetical protein
MEVHTLKKTRRTERKKEKKRKRMRYNMHPILQG